MPRISAESRSAALFRAQLKRRPVPRRLKPAAKAIWQDIVDDRPADWFRAGNWELLEQYCELLVQQRACLDALAKLQPTEEGYSALLRSASRLAATLTILATKLRLTVQWDVQAKSRKTDEKGQPAHDPLLGGLAWREQSATPGRVVRIGSRPSSKSI
jgi:hypothetical protein